MTDCNFPRKLALMEQANKTPVWVGVTGHRNICREDAPTLIKQVRKALTDVQSLCAIDTPVVMLCGMAQGADILCAEVAFEVGVPVYAVLPFNAERFRQTFDDETDKNKLYGLLDKCERLIYVDDIEGRNRQDDDYRYRQAGIYIAHSCPVVIALWDGKGPANASDYGCGTAETVQFALENGSVDGKELRKSGALGRSAVIWVKTNRREQGAHISDNDGNEWLVSKDRQSLLGEVRSAVLEEDATLPFTKTRDVEVKYYQRYQCLAKAPQFLVKALNK